MWFKNLLLYRLDEASSLTPEQVAAGLEAHAFKPCGGLQPYSFGWSPPLGRLGSEMVHAANGCTLVCLRREERVLPPAVVREAVVERIAAIEEGEMRTVRARERRRIRDEVLFDLMPRAFTRSHHTFAYLSPRDGWLVVDTASPKRAEELVVLLAQSVNGLVIEPFEAAHAPAALMTRWLAGERLPRGFVLHDECELRDPSEEGAVVRCLRQDLAAEEVRAHLRAHKMAARLALGFEERLSFVLGADLALKRLRFDAVSEQDDTGGDDELASLDADFAFMTSELARLLARLLALFSATEPAAGGP